MYQKSTWIQLNDSMFELVSAQLKDVEKAVYGMGEYQFKPTYSHFEVSSNRWFLMTSQQREKHLKKMFDTDFIPTFARTNITPSSVSVQGGRKYLSVPMEQAGISHLSSELIQKTWEKAERLYLRFPRYERCYVYCQ